MNFQNDSHFTKTFLVNIQPSPPRARLHPTLQHFAKLQSLDVEISAMLMLSRRKLQLKS